jgi:hypothetical protein
MSEITPRTKRQRNAVLCGGPKSLDGRSIHVATSAKRITVEGETYAKTSCARREGTDDQGTLLVIWMWEEAKQS